MSKKFLRGKWIIALLLCIFVMCPFQTKAASKVAINKKSAVIVKNKTLQLKIKGTSKKVKWSSSNKNVAKVSAKGKVTAKKPGAATVTAKIGKKKYSCKVIIPNKTMKLCKNANSTMKASELKGKVSWSSSNKKRVSISKKGKIDIKKSGKVILTGKSGSKKYRIYLTVLNKKHSWKKVSEKKATCTEEGTITYRCKYCGESYQDKIDALGHDYTKKVIAPTCDSKGYTIYTCKRNKKHTVIKNFVKEKGHKYGTWKTQKKPTCNTTGWQTTVCSVCKNTIGRDIPAIKHEYVNGVCKYCHATNKRSTANKMDVQVTKDKINIHIDGVGKASDGTLRLIKVSPNEYADGDKLSGISKDTNASGTELAVYAYQTDTTISIDRYDAKGCDRLYSKYYVISSKGVVKGPIYPSQIVPERKTKKFTTVTKKGLFGDDSEDMVEDTGSKYTVINLDLPNLLVASKDNNGNLTNAEKEGTYEWTSQGKHYYFNKGYVDYFDKKIKSYTNKGIGVSLILYSARVEGWKDNYPASLLYEGGCNRGSIAGINTSSREGVENWVAAIEFLAERYSRENEKYGHINNVVIGNEIDFAYAYNNISNKATSLDVYMEEYSRLLRLTHMAISKYMDTVTVTVPTTHDWMKAEHDNSYKPKEIFDWLNKKTKAEGDFNWGLSPHCYSFSLAGSFCTEDDSINGRKYGMSDDMNTSQLLSFSNLEILEQYLEQSSMKCNGQMRDVYLTESGCSSYLQSEQDLRRQAAYAAAAYYKASILDCVDAIIYYRGIDHDAETSAGATFGLRDNKGQNKYAYDVWKYIDTQYSFKAANKYLNVTAYYDKGVLNVPGENSGYMDSKEIAKYHHTVANGKIKSYKDLMYAFSEDYDWDSAWDEKKIIRQTAESVPEWDDKVDLGNVKFYEKSFLADGKEHELVISGQLPSGVTVQYENNKRTDKGTQEATAKFYKDGELVGTRTAQMQVSDMITNRSVYETGEKIYITANAVNNTQWVGIYKKGDKVGDVSDGGIPSVYWYYVNDGNQVSGNTYALQEIGQYNPNRPELKDLPAGEYEIVLMGKDSTYSKDEVVNITILDTGKKSGLPRLDAIEYKDTVKEYNGKEQSLEITGELPANVTVTYTNNKITEAGKVQATAHFLYYGQELETRTATLSLEAQAEKTLTTDKDVYQYGEDIMVTATGNNKDWVALYKKDDVIGSTKDGGIESIYWYYVASDNVSGQPFNIRKGRSNSSRKDWSEVSSLPAGEYKLLLLENDTYNVLKEKDFTITGEAPVVEEKSITTDKESYTEGEDIKVTAVGDKADWVGIYKEDDKVGSISNGGVPSIYWYTVNDGTHKSGDAVSIKRTTGATERSDWDEVKNLPAGKYKVVLLENGGYTILKQKVITILPKEEEPDTSKLRIDKKEYLMGEDIKVTAIGEGESVWVGLYRKNDPTDGSVTSIYWYMVNDTKHQSGNTYGLKDMTDDNCDHGTRVAYKYLTPGEYKWVLTPEDGSYNVAEEVDFVIKPNEEIESKLNLVDPSATYSPNSEIRVATKAYTNTGKDWIAIFKEGVDYTDSKADYDSWSYIVDSNITTIKAPSTPGKYKLVYFGEDARHIIATRDITITTP